MLPPCFSEPDYLGWFPLSVSLVKIHVIEQMSANARVKQLAKEGASMLRVLEMAHVLARGESVSPSELKKVKDQQAAAKDKLSKVEITLEDSKDKLKKKTAELAKKAEV